MGDKYVLAIDQSTQGTKALLFDMKGDVACRYDMPHKQIINEQGWVSHDLNEIYQNTVEVVSGLIKKSGVDKNSIACLGISNQRETSAAWDKATGNPLANAIVWQCSRAEKICERVSNTSTEEMVFDKTGMKLSPYFPAAKFAWLLENEETVKKAYDNNCLCLGTIDAWLIYKLTKGASFATDYSNASRTQLFNIQELKWDDELCSLFGIDKKCLPEVRNSNDLYGYTDFEGFFDEPIPIHGAIGDSQGALFGQGGIRKGMVKATYGTGSSVMMNAGEQVVKSQNGLATSLAWGIDGQVTYVLEGNINYTGAVISWLKDDLGLIQSPKDTEKLAFEANQNDTTYLVPAFSGLGAPYWKSEAKAALVGMSRTTKRAEIVKAAVESIAYQIADIFNIMGEDSGQKMEELFVDGGPTANNYLMQFQSDIAGTRVTLPRCEESSAQGAAFMAGLGMKLYGEDVLNYSGDRKSFGPKMSEQTRKRLYDGWKKAVKETIMQDQKISADILEKAIFVDKAKVEEFLEMEEKKNHKKLIVLDDDPTGVQTVHDVSVYTDWSMQSIRQGFAEENNMFFILTNSRGFTVEQTTKAHKEIAANIDMVAKETGIDYLIISRGDSTLRGHYPLETELLKSVITEKNQYEMDGEIICPYFREGGRFTINDTHYVRYGNQLVPAGETEFAKDETFGYSSSNLCEYVEEKTEGKYKAKDCISISLEMLQSMDIDRIQKTLESAHDFQKIIVNAIDDINVKIFCIALYRAMANGKHYMIRCAAALVKAIGNISDQPLLTREKMVTEKKPAGGIIVVGSHTKKTTAQLEELKQLTQITFIEMNSDLVLVPGELEVETARILREEEKLISEGRTVCVSTKRTLLKVENDTPEEALLRSVRISDALQNCVGKLQVTPAFIVAKGGITSSDVGTKALKVKCAKVLGQIQPGIPVWQIGEESTFPGTPYVIFPGNVGNEDTLKKAVESLL